MKVDEQLKCKDCDWYGSCEYYDRRKETSQICKMFNNTWKFVAELEKIKSEIQEIRMEEPLMSRAFECYGFKDKTPEDIKTEVIELLDERIYELKGENNETDN